MTNGNPEQAGPGAIFWVFMAVWIPLVIVNACFFFGSRDARLKRKVLPWVLVGGGTLFVLFMVLISGELWVLFFGSATVFLVGVVTLRGTRFCDRCGATLYNQFGFCRRLFCPYCGAALENVGQSSFLAGSAKAERR